MSERERDKEKSRLQHAGVQQETNFNEMSPRPWVPGEERAHCKSDWGTLQSDWSKHKSVSPAPTPRRTSLPTNHLYSSNDACAAPMGYEPEGSARVRQPRAIDSCSPPPYLLWARALHYLLEDSDGVDLFRRYLQSEGGPHANVLDFWFACKGLHNQTEPEKIAQLVRVIYKRFFLRSTLPISDELRREVGRRVKETQGGQGQENVFDEAQMEVRRLINNTTYSNFLQSKMYLQYVQAMQNPASAEFSSGSGSSSSSSSISAREMALLSQSSGLLPTLHEESELITNNSVPVHSSSTGSISAGHHTPVVEPMRLTKDILLATQKRRLDVRPKPEAYAGMYAVNHGYRVNWPYHHSAHPHASYSSYNPVSRQDSELQSLSSHSDARTESDNMSLTDSSLDGISMYRTSRKQSRQASRAARELAALNRDPYIHQTLIPRTQRIDNKQCQPWKPDEFAAILIDKLENVKREQDAQDKLDRKLMENECGVPDTATHINEEQSKTLADAIRLKLHIVDDDDQDILDQHVSRVWSDLTPSRSPGLMSPRAHSPTRRYGAGASYSRSRRKEKDVFSTFSSDSGNVHDFPDAELKSLGMVKSKSMPEDGYSQDRFVRQSASRRSSSKKTLTDLTDSGVSVVSDTPPVPHVPVPPVGKDTRVLTWLMESDRPARTPLHTHSEMSMKHRSHRPSSATSPNANRHRKNYNHSRSSSLERGSVTSSLGERSDRIREPAQPFVADPNMPPMQPPHTTIQLEEARRRLMEDDLRGRQNRQRGSGKSHMADSLSNQSTLRKSTRGSRPSVPLGAPAQPPAEEFTTVMFSFCDEQFPYRTKIPGKQITLRQFKEYLPKKGNYRYFFKTECEELDNQVIQEEICADSDLLPLWEGKVMAQVKPTE